MTAVGERPDVARWLPFRAEGTLRLYCLPHAGGSASAFRQWTGRLGDVAVRPVQPPARETRLRDTPVRDMAELARSIAAVIETDADGAPFAIYGHSLGALVGFEVVRELRRRGACEPVALIASGAPAPDDDRPDPEPAVADMDDEQVVGLLRRLGGTPEWLLRDTTARSLILPPFVADFTVKQRYRYEPDVALAVPITTIASTVDPRVSVAQMAQWGRHTSAGLTQHVLSGGHFAVLEQAATTLAMIGRALSTWATVEGVSA